MPEAKEVLSPEGHQLVDKFLSEVHTMRKYQKQFFDGNKGVLRTAMYWENQVDNTRTLMAQRFGIQVKETKGPANQGKLM